MPVVIHAVVLRLFQRGMVVEFLSRYHIAVVLLGVIGLSADLWEDQVRRRME